MKKIYTSPCLEITKLMSEDVITLSGAGTLTDFTGKTFADPSALGITAESL